MERDDLKAAIFKFGGGCLAAFSFDLLAHLFPGVAAAVDDPASLERLHDIVVPPPVPWWPLAPGWYFVMAAVALVGIGCAVKALARWRANAYRRAALAELKGIVTAWEGDPRDCKALSALPALLKRVALVAFPRADVASLTGAAWCEFLDRTADQPLFAPGPAETLRCISYTDAATQDLSQQELTAALAAARTWIRSHYRSTGPCRAERPGGAN